MTFNGVRNLYRIIIKIFFIMTILSSYIYSVEVVSVSVSYSGEDERNWYYYVVVETDDYVPPPEWSVVVTIYPLQSDVDSRSFNLGNGYGPFGAEIAIDKQLVKTTPLYAKAGISIPGNLFYTANSLVNAPKDDQDDPYDENPDDRSPGGNPLGDPDDPEPPSPDDDGPTPFGECSSGREGSTIRMGPNTKYKYGPSTYGYDGPIKSMRRSRRSGGYPVLSLNQKSFNVIAKDIPIWYDTGYGPDIHIELHYSGRSVQPEIIGGTESTVYFPFGNKWYFNYGLFYQEELEGKHVRFFMPDGSYYIFEYDQDNDEYLSQKGVYNRLIKDNNEFILFFKSSKLKYHFGDPNSRKLTSIEDRNGNFITLIYDTDYNIDYILDANNRKVEFTIDPETKLITKIEDPISRSAIFNYNSDNLLSEITDMGGYSSNIEYDVVTVWTKQWANVSNDVRMTKLTTPFGTTSMDYKVPSNSFSEGEIIASIDIINPLGNSQTLKYIRSNSTEMITQISDFKGNYTEYFVDRIKLNVKKIRLQDGNEIIYEYDDDNNMTRRTHANLSVSFAYDLVGNVISFTNLQNQLYQYDYDIDNNLIEEKNPLGHITHFEYDANNNMTKLILPLSEHNITYNSRGKIIKYINPNGNIYNLQYDQYGYLTTIEYPKGPQTVFINDDVGRQHTINENGKLYQFQYDDLNNVITKTFPDGSTEQAEFKLFDITKFSDINNLTTEYEYNGMHSIISQEKSDMILRFERDANENLTGINVNGQTTTYYYDRLNRITKLINPDGTARTYEYDPFGNIIMKIDERGIQTNYTYQLNQLTDIMYSDGTDNINYQYNGIGKIIRITDGIGTTNISYDAEDRIVQYDGPLNNDTKHFAYDKVGNKTSVTIPNMHINYAYDDLDRLVTVTSEYGSAIYEWDQNTSLLNKIIYGNNTLCEYEYDQLPRIISIKNTNSQNELISSYKYTYDTGLLISEIIDKNNNHFLYDYDNTLRIIKEEVRDKNGKYLWIDEYTYDNLGNRMEQSRNGIKKTFNYNINNQLTNTIKPIVNLSGTIEGAQDIEVYVEGIKANTKNLLNNKIQFEVNQFPINLEADTIGIAVKIEEGFASIDDESFLIEGVTPENNIIEINIIDEPTTNTIGYFKNYSVSIENGSYTYDLSGNLIQESFGNKVINYSYDAENQLTNVQLPNGKNFEYRYDSYGQLVRVYENGSLLKEYIYNTPFVPMLIKHNNNVFFITNGLSSGEGGVGGIINISDNNSNTYHYYDINGNVVNTISDQLEQNEFTYNAFGKVEISNTEEYNQFFYGTKEYNRETGLHCFGYRFYQSENGRWISKDPIGTTGHGVNLYAYCKNNPKTWYDPFGLYTFETGPGERLEIVTCGLPQPWWKQFEGIWRKVIYEIYKDRRSPEELEEIARRNPGTVIGDRG